MSRVWWPHPLPTSNSALECEESLWRTMLDLLFNIFLAMLERDFQRNKNIFNHAQIESD